MIIDKSRKDSRKKSGQKSDEELIFSVQEGNSEAFDQLVTRYKNRLYAYLLRLTGNPDEAEEFAQETFVKAYINADKYKPIAKFSTWLYTIGTNLVRNRIRNRKRRPKVWSLWNHNLDDGGGWMEIEDKSQDSEQNADREKLQDFIQQAIEEIPGKYRTAFVLREIENLSYEEISASTGTKLGTVRSRINRGRKYFKTAVTPYLKGDIRFKEK
ncbi:MAG: sigma-70 family RNA polymerase sigma factor [Candidatus Krumholzibacteriota bacterium]|nr:sigma-70 family RNA polymerase sigma factor [Candidatus Krumholzibacteriota bacterium]